MVTLSLTESEAEYLDDILQLWIDGYPEATTQVEEDNSLDDAEQWLSAVDGMREGRVAAEDIRRKVQVGRSVLS